LVGGCATNSSKSIVFNAEKLYHKAEKLNETALIKPELVDETTKKNIKDAYYKATGYCWKNMDSLPIQKFPDERRDLESIAFLATNRLTQIYLTESKYDSVILIIRQLHNFTNLEGKPLLSSQLSLARALQARGDWSNAMNIYRALIDSFYPPVDNNNEIIFRVINLPLEIVRIYNLLGDEKEVALESQSAETYYKQLMKEWPNSTIETASRSNLARLYYSLKKWDKSIENLKMVKDSTGEINIDASLMIAGITATDKNDYNAAIKMYDELIGRVEDSTMLPVIMMRKGIVQYEKKNYNNCRKVMSQIKNEYSVFYHNNPLPQKYTALCYEQLGNWGRAENEFRWLIDNYAATEAAFDAYLKIADHYKNEKNKDLTKIWYQRAENFYAKMARQYSGTSIEASSISYLAEISKRRGKWDKTAKYLESIFNSFPKSNIGQRSLTNAAAIYREKLNNSIKADSLISRLKMELYLGKEGKNINIITENNN
jgi:tetratricopeptide (TPR) repeat protein